MASSMTSDADQLPPKHTSSHRRCPQASRTPTWKLKVLVSIMIFVWRYYIHKVPVILNNNLQNESHKPYDPPYTSHVISNYYLSRRILPSPSVYRKTLIHAHINSYTVLTCTIGLDKLVLPAAEFCHIVKLVPIYESQGYVKHSMGHPVVFK